MLLRVHIAMLFSLGLLGGLLGGPAPARACQLSCTPINLILTYLPGHSNWGPQKATGVVELVLSEGEARGRVTGLPALDGEVYQVWLTNTQTDELLAFGTFNADQAQRAQFRFILSQDPPSTAWNLLFITVQPGPEGPPSDKRSIGAFFPGPDQKGNLPNELPNTGGTGADGAIVPPTRASLPEPLPPSQAAHYYPVQQSPTAVPAVAARPASAPTTDPAGPSLALVAGLTLLAGTAGCLAGYRWRRGRT